jgi:beta-1,4-N-acetylglucosaminyltransferase
VLRVEAYLPSLAEVIASAALVISHAGAGSIFESLTFSVPLIVVPNALLMDNHQVELAQLLEARRHAVGPVSLCTLNCIELYDSNT